MKTLTFRAIFERDSILKLLDEPEFEHNLHRRVICNVKPANDHYLAVFVFTAEPQDDGTILLRAVSTTVVGIQRYTTARLQHQGIYVSKPEETSVLAETLRAHFRAQQEDTIHRLSVAAGSIRLPWAQHNFPNGAGDLSSPPEFFISDPDLEELEKLFNTPDPSSESDDSID